MNFSCIRPSTIGLNSHASELTKGGCVHVSHVETYSRMVVLRSTFSVRTAYIYLGLSVHTLQPLIKLQSRKIISGCGHPNIFARALFQPPSPKHPCLAIIASVQEVVQGRSFLPSCNLSGPRLTKVIHLS